MTVWCKYTRTHKVEIYSLNVLIFTTLIPFRILTFIVLIKWDRLYEDNINEGDLKVSLNGFASLLCTS